jgi:hypothetical protein
MLRTKTIAIAMLSSLTLTFAGCGTAPGDRLLSGGLLGAGSGAAIGAVAGDAGKGALIGGLGGAAIGLLTSPSVLNLGTPAWKQTTARRTTTRTATARATATRTAQNCTTRETSTQRITTCKK